ncbi:MAG: endonuclease, partial [Bacteroidales bacterium]
MIKRLLSLSLCAFAGVFFTLYAQEPDGYYVQAEGSKKEQLKTKLSSIVNSGAKTIGYDGLWTAYKSTDLKEDGTYYDIYSTCTFSPGVKQCGNYKYVCDCHNREHTVPQSWFSKASPMVSDIIHVLPTDGKVNGQRSNYPYGECASGDKESEKALGRLGACTFPTSYSGKVFEPDDEFKGDIARIYFYMATRYESKVGSWGGEAFGNGSYPGLKPWQIELMLKWHRQDPVSSKEIKRNNGVYSVQKNRNPFVDHPELAEHIWGTKMNEIWNLTSSLDKVSDLKIYGYARSVKIEGVSSAISFKVYNVAGHVVKQGYAEEDCSVSLPQSGIYIVSVQTNNNVIN